MSSKPEASAYWDALRGRIRSRAGGWRVGEAVWCRGYSLLDELVGEVSYFQVMMLNILGYLPERRLADWVEGSYICMSYPDPRIWCNQIGALGGDARASVAAATTVGILAADSSMYGPRTLVESADFIQRNLVIMRNGTTAEDIVREAVAGHHGKATIMGYARPLASGDERIVALERLRLLLNFDVGPHLNLAYDIDGVLRRHHGEGMNVGGYSAAFLSDQGLSPKEIYQVCALCVASGVAACYEDASARPATSFLPLRCGDIEYHGKPYRRVPVRNT